MSAEDLSDVWRELRALQQAVRDLQTDTSIENTSISDGELRLIRASLKVDGAVPIVLKQGNNRARINFGTDAFISAADNGVTIAQENLGAWIAVSPGTAAMQGGVGFIEVNDTDIIMSGLPTQGAMYYLGITSDNRVVKLSGGGPGPSDPPIDPGTPGDNPSGYIYPVDPTRWTLGDDFAEHVARGSQEPGIDWWTTTGTPVWAPGAGTIVDVHNATSGATGRYVTLVTDAGDWFRFLHLSSVNGMQVGQTVTQGQVIAYTGASGFGSEIGYGQHIHVSFKVGYTGTWPGGDVLDDFLAYMAA